jgi:hypothetical protein
VEPPGARAPYPRPPESPTRSMPSGSGRFRNRFATAAGAEAPLRTRTLNRKPHAQREGPQRPRAILTHLTRDPDFEGLHTLRSLPLIKLDLFTQPLKTLKLGKEMADRPLRAALFQGHDCTERFAGQPFHSWRWEAGQDPGGLLEENEFRKSSRDRPSNRLPPSSGELRFDPECERSNMLSELQLRRPRSGRKLLYARQIRWGLLWLSPPELYASISHL